MSVDVSRFKIGLIQSVDECGSCRKGGKALKACTVDIGESSPITVVTSATIRVGSRLVSILQANSLKVADCLKLFGQ